jgi:hypothetical protein
MALQDPAPRARRLSWPKDTATIKGDEAGEGMNWKRGLVRMWLLLSVLWAAFWIGLMLFVGDGGAVLVAFATLPFALFLLGYGLLWIGRGFRPRA